MRRVSGSEAMTAAESVARAFHEAYERLAPAFGYETRPESAVAWGDVPAPNRDLMIATVQDLLDQGVVTGPLDPRHIVEIRPDGWALQHPVTCRDDLFCQIHKLIAAGMATVDEPPGPLGRYPVRLEGDEDDAVAVVDFAQPLSMGKAE